MTKTVMCKKYKKEMAALERAPFPGQKGQDILNHVSKQAWLEWQNLQTMLINEKQLNMMMPDARQYVMEQMERFFNNEETDKISGYVDFDDIQEV
ncbi:oxidative damage protection protein [Marinomonas agarivorans]|nr:oxidative damage protection protein [Marinomonas agarivorans]